MRATKVETRGSYWWLDDEAGCYLRMPKHEAPRELAEWGNEDAGILQDYIWHPMVDWEISCHPMCRYIEGGHLLACPGLRIQWGDDREKSWAPNAEIV